MPGSQTLPQGYGEQVHEDIQVVSRAAAGRTHSTVTITTHDWTATGLSVSPPLSLFLTNSSPLLSGSPSLSFSLSLSLYLSPVQPSAGINGHHPSQLTSIIQLAAVEFNNNSDYNNVNIHDNDRSQNIWAHFYTSITAYFFLFFIFQSKRRGVFYLFNCCCIIVCVCVFNFGLNFNRKPRTSRCRPRREYRVYRVRARF